MVATQSHNGWSQSQSHFPPLKGECTCDRCDRDRSVPGGVGTNLALPP